MSSLNSSIGYLGIAKQAVKGTAVTPARFLKCTDVDFKPAHKPIDGKPEVSPNARSKTFLHAGPLHYTGSIKADLVRPETLPLLLVGAGLSDAKTGAGPEYTHTLTPVDALPWLTFEDSIDATLIRQYVDSVVDKFTLKVAAGECLSLAASILAIKENTITATAVTEETGPVLTFDEATITFDGAATLPFSMVQFDFDNKCSSDEYKLGSRLLSDITPKRRDLAFSGEVKMSDTTLYKKINYGGSGVSTVGADMYECTNTSILLTSGTLIGGGAVYYSVEIQIPRMVLTEMNPPQGDDKPVWVTIKGEPLKNTTDPICTIIVKNSISAAY